MQHFTKAPAAAAPGLDLFAAAWLERWLKLGGSMIAKPDGGGYSYCLANVEDVPGYVPPSEELPPEQREWRRTWDDGMFIGRTRELLDLLELVPGGREAVKAHVRQYPSAVYRDRTAVLA